jgi:hypothetical protein
MSAVARLKDRADRIGEFWGHPEDRSFNELLIDLEKDKAARAVIFALLREMERHSQRRPASRPSGTLSPRVLLNGHLRRGSLTLRDDEESVSFEQDLLHVRDEVLSNDHELAGVVPGSLVLGLRDRYGSVTFLQTTLANDDSERVLRIGLVRRLDAFIDLP